MISEADLQGLQATLAWATFAIAFALGALMHRTNFCTMGAIADIVNLGDWTRLKMWVAAIGVAIIGTQGLALAGLFDPSQSIYATPSFTWLSYVVGGALFGFGMVLASGCGSKTLIRLGAGNLKSLVVFIVMGVAAYMTLRGLFAVARSGWLDPVRVVFAHGQDLPRLLAGDAPAALTRWRTGLGLVLGGAALAWAFADREFRRVDPLLGALGTGLAVVAVWYVSGHMGFLAEHPKTLEPAFVGTNSGRAEALSFVAPAAYTLELLMLWSDQSRTVTVGIASALGMAAGACAHALATRRFRWEGFRDAEDTANHLVGAVLMGAGGVTALGCSIGQGLSGLSTLALGSIVTFAAIVAGALAALRYQVWRFERMEG